MTPQQIFVVFVVGSATVGFLFFPLEGRLSKALVSSYPKVDLRKRMLAAAIDAMVCMTCLVLLAPAGMIIALTLSPLYLFVRDCLFPGQSPGKLLLGLEVIQLENGARCQAGRALRRNAIFAVPGFNAAALLFEAGAVRSNRQGMRYGDRLAQTQVVEGKDAKDLVRSLQERLLRAARHLEVSSHNGEQPIMKRRWSMACDRLTHVEGAAEPTAATDGEDAAVEPKR